MELHRLLPMGRAQDEPQVPRCPEGLVVACKQLLGIASDEEGLSVPLLRADSVAHELGAHIPLRPSIRARLFGMDRFPMLIPKVAEKASTDLWWPLGDSLIVSLL